MLPRPYQSGAIESTLKGFESFNRQLGVLPTGGGKTLVFSWLAQRLLPKPTLILAHREELIDQAIAKLHSATGIFAQKEKAEHRASRNAQVVVASVQSMINRLAKWPSDHFGLIVADEAHHAISDSWQRVLQHFSGKQLGVTATPDRGDKRNLGQFYENIAFEVSLFDLIHQGYLSRISVQSVPLRIDLNAVTQSAGDFDAASLGHELEPYLDRIAQAIKERAMFRKTLAFLPLIATSRKFVAACEKVGLAAKHVDGNSPDRKAILHAFDQGEYDVLSNAMLLTEGYDCPSVDCVVNLRVTRSRSLYSQIVGRGTRICPGKDHLLLLDFLWQHERHNLIRPAHLVASSDDEARDMTERAQAKGGGEKDLELLQSETQVQREKKLREELARKAKKQARVVDAMEFCLNMNPDCDLQTAMRRDGDLRDVEPAQLEILSKFDIDPKSLSGNAHANRIIGMIVDREQKGLATPKQLKELIRFNHPRAQQLTKGQAGLFLNKKYAELKRS